MILVLLMKRRFHEAMLAMILLLIPMSVVCSPCRAILSEAVFLCGAVWSPFLEKTSFSASCFYCCSCIDGISVYLDVVCKKTDYGIDVDRQSANWALKKD